MNAEELRAHLSKSLDTEIVPVTTPEWPVLDGHIFVRSMTLKERESYLLSLQGPSGVTADGTPTVKVQYEGANAKLAAITMCDKDGTPLFSGQPGDVEILERKSGNAMQRVIDVSARINRLNRKALEESKNA
jgi:hypothetical protein